MALVDNYVEPIARFSVVRNMGNATESPTTVSRPWQISKWATSARYVGTVCLLNLRAVSHGSRRTCVAREVSRERSGMLAAKFFWETGRKVPLLQYCCLISIAKLQRGGCGSDEPNCT